MTRCEHSQVGFESRRCNDLFYPQCGTAELRTRDRDLPARTTMGGQFPTQLCASSGHKTTTDPQTTSRCCCTHRKKTHAYCLSPRLSGSLPHPVSPGAARIVAACKLRIPKLSDHAYTLPYRVRDDLSSWSRLNSRDWACRRVLHGLPNAFLDHLRTESHKMP